MSNNNLSSMWSDLPPDLSCVICCCQLIDTSFDEQGAQILCRLLALPVGQEFLKLLQSVTYCPTCVRKISQIGISFNQLDELEQKLALDKSSIEEQLKQSHGRVKECDTLGKSTQQGVREILISYFNQDLNWSSNNKIGKDVGNDEIQLLSDNTLHQFGDHPMGLEFNFECQDSQGDEFAPPSPTTSIVSYSSSFEEKITPDIIFKTVKNDKQHEDDQENIPILAPPPPLPDLPLFSAAGRPIRRASAIARSRFPIVLVDKLDNDESAETVKNSQKKRSHHGPNEKARRARMQQMIGRVKATKKTAKRRFRIRKKVDVHLRRKCPVEDCGLRFLISEEYRRQAHVRRAHEGIVDCYVCEVCNDTFRSLVQWKVHTAKHTGVPAFVCKYCQLDCKNPRSLKIHVSKVHEPDKAKYKCTEPDCSQAFVFQYLLNEHGVRAHQKEHPYLCEICSETFRDQRTLRVHQVRHQPNNESIKCSDCGKSFAHPRYLDAHVKITHTKEFKFRCELCDYGCLKKSALDGHMMSAHSEDRTMKCDQCPAAYKLKKQLVVHMRTHSGVRPHKCKTCPKTFTCPSRLTRHELIHSGKECHVCPVCGRSFPVKNYLYKHMRCHEEDKDKYPKYPKRQSHQQQKQKQKETTDEVAEKSQIQTKPAAVQLQNEYPRLRPQTIGIIVEECPQPQSEFVVEMVVDEMWM